MYNKEMYRNHAIDALRRMKENGSEAKETLNIKELDPSFFDSVFAKELMKSIDTVTNTPEYHEMELGMNLSTNLLTLKDEKETILRLIDNYGDTDGERVRSFIERDLSVFIDYISQLHKIIISFSQENKTPTETPSNSNDLESEVALIMGLITDAKSQLDNVDNELDINQLSIVKNDLPIYTSDFSEIKYKLAIIGTCLDSVYWFIYNNMEKPNAAEVKFETVCDNQLISDHGEKIDEYVKNHIIYPPTHSEENLPGNVNRIDLIKELNELRDSVFRVIGYIDGYHDLIYDTLVSEENGDHVKCNTRIFELWEINEHCKYIKKMMNEMIDKYNKLDGND